MKFSTSRIEPELHLLGSLGPDPFGANIGMYKERYVSVHILDSPLILYIGDLEGKRNQKSDEFVGGGAGRQATRLPTSSPEALSLRTRMQHR